MFLLDTGIVLELRNAKAASPTRPGRLGRRHRAPEALHLG
jgi:hypothetical protein